MTYTDIHTDLYSDLSTDLYSDLCSDLSTDLYTVLCSDLYTDLYTDLCIDFYIDLCIDLCSTKYWPGFLTADAVALVCGGCLTGLFFFGLFGLPPSCNVNKALLAWTTKSI